MRGKRYAWQALTVVCLILIPLVALPAPIHAGTAPPTSTSDYGMDMFGLGWQWVFPRIPGSPRLSGPIRVDLLDSALRQAADAGVRWNRVSAWWCSLEPERGKFFWDDLDAVIQIGRNYGIGTVPTLLYTPYWAIPGAPKAVECINNRQKNYPPADMADWENFIRAIVRRYGPAGNNTVHAWEIWNEPDLPEFLSIKNDWGDGTVPVYAELLVRAARIIRSEAPGARILIGGLSDIRGAGFLDKLLKLRGDKDIRQSFDVVSLHAYSVHAYKIGQFREVLAAHGLSDRPLWDSELNYLGWDYEQSQAGLPDLYKVLQLSGVSRSFWFLSTTSRWGPGIFLERQPTWEPLPFTQSPFYAAFKAQAAPARLPGAPAAFVCSGEDGQQVFEWQAAARGLYPIAGYKLQVDTHVFMGMVPYARPELDLWLSGQALTFVPLTLGGGAAIAAGVPQTVVSASATLLDTFSYTAALSPGSYYWRIAAVDTRGNVGPYTRAARLVVRGQHLSFLPLTAQ